MLTRNRLFVAMGALGLGSIAGACTSPTDEELTEPSTHPVESGLTSNEAEDIEATDPNAPLEDEADSSELQSPDDRFYGGGHRPRRCNYDDAWHCRRGHRGWRWVNRRPGEDPGWGGGGGWGSGRPRRCCVRVHHHY
ncbi:MAG: hypothetical protein K0S65_1648 [Labilithrix sp.]|nr:hypothetical protein [Labilithrix sp.]